MVPIPDPQYAISQFLMVILLWFPVNPFGPKAGVADMSLESDDGDIGPPLNPKK